MAIDRDRIETLWRSGKVEELASELAARRAEWSAHAVDRARAVPCAAALAILTLQEIGTPSDDALVEELGRALSDLQDGSGAWENPWTTALVLRAYAVAGLDPAGLARGLAYLSSSQDVTGSWRTAEAEAFHDTAFVLTMLGDLEDFRHAVDVRRALDWCEEQRVVTMDGSPLLESSEKQWTVARQLLPAEDKGAPVH